MLGEKLSVRPPEFFPATDIGYEHSGADDRGSASAELFERLVDDLETSFGLGVTVTGGEHPLVARGPTPAPAARSSLAAKPRPDSLGHCILLRQFLRAGALTGPNF